MTTEDSTHEVPEAERVLRSLKLIDDAVAKYNPCAVLGLFSGGHDSLTAVHVAARHPRFDYAVHINTGIGVPETRDFVRSSAAKFNWDLHEYSAKACGQDYEKIVAQYGFPGPGQHSTMYIRLKERPLRVAMAQAKLGYKRNRTVLLISGVRFQESERRMGYQEPVTKDGSKIWVNVINDWSKADCNRYLENNKVQRSPVVDKIHKSGECLCGAFAKPGELDELAFWYPEYAAYIRSLPAAGAHAWGTKPGKKTKAGPMCSSCTRQEIDDAVAAL